MIFYHVAPRKYRDKILSDGLKSKGSVRKHNEYPEEVRDWITSEDVVYLIWDLDKWFSYTSYTEPTDIWKVSIKDESKLVQDSGHYIYPDEYYEDPSFDKEDLIEDLKEWKWTAEDAGTAAYIGDISPSQIKLMTTVKNYLNEHSSTMKLTESKLRSIIREELSEMVTVDNIEEKTGVRLEDALKVYKSVDGSSMKFARKMMNKFNVSITDAKKIRDAIEGSHGDPFSSAEGVQPPPSWRNR